MKISVVTIVRNAAEDLEGTIRSVQEQTTLPFEHVVVDGASTDRTLEVGRAYAASHPEGVVFLSEPDKGIADALNKGARLASGDYVVCMNAGDRFHDASSMARILSATATAPAGAVLYGDADLVYPTFTSRKVVRHERLLSPFAFWNPLSHQAMAVPRSAMLEFPFDPTLRYSMDLDVWIRMLRKGRVFRRVDACLCRYAIGGISSRRENFPKIQEEHLRVYRQHGLRRKEIAALLLRTRLALERIGGESVRKLIEKRQRMRRG